MKILDFKIEIKAPKEKIWSVLWDDETYGKWTAVFCEGSYAVSDWKEGSVIQFLSPTGEGMNSVIDKKTDNEYIASSIWGKSIIYSLFLLMPRPKSGRVRWKPIG